MSEDAYRGLDDLKVNPFITPQKELKAAAEFNCPICGERIKMLFTREDLKMLLQGFQGRLPK